MRYLIILLAITCSSCYVTRTDVGNYSEQKKEHDHYRYDRVKQVYLFWGLAPLGRSSVNKPPEKTYRIVSKSNAGDFFFNCLFGGFLSMRTIKVEAIERNSGKH